MKKLFYLYCKLFGHPDLPPKFLFKMPKSKKAFPHLSVGYWPRYKEMTYRWLIGNDIEIIAEKFNVTRTRVVNCIWKEFREQK